MNYILIGGPGSGKSYKMTKLVETTTKAVVYCLPIREPFIASGFLVHKYNINEIWNYINRGYSFTDCGLFRHVALSPNQNIKRNRPSYDYFTNDECKSIKKLMHEYSKNIWIFDEAHEIAPQLVSELLNHKQKRDYVFLFQNINQLISILKKYNNQILDDIDSLSCLKNRCKIVPVKMPNIKLNEEFLIDAVFRDANTYKFTPIL